MTFLLALALTIPGAKTCGEWAWVCKSYQECEWSWKERLCHSDDESEEGPELEEVEDDTGDE